MLCENPKTNVAARNSWKSRGKLKNLFLVRVIIVSTLLCHSDSSHTRLCRNYKEHHQHRHTGRR